MGQKGYLCLKR